MEEQYSTITHVKVSEKSYCFHTYHSLYNYANTANIAMFTSLVHTVNKQLSYISSIIITAIAYKYIDYTTQILITTLYRYLILNCTNLPYELYFNMDSNTFPNNLFVLIFYLFFIVDFYRCRHKFISHFQKCI